MNKIKESIQPTTYTEKEVLKEALKYFKGDELAATTWMNKYAMKTKEGDFLEASPVEMHVRMAKEFARIEKNYKDNELSVEGLSEYGKTREFLSEETIFNLFDKFKYVIPQGSVMSSLGKYNVIVQMNINIK